MPCSGCAAAEAGEAVSAVEIVPLSESRQLPASHPKRDPDRLLPLVSEVVGQGHSVLVFCAGEYSRSRCYTCGQTFQVFQLQVIVMSPAASQ